MAGIALEAGSRNAEEDLPPRLAGLSHQPGDDAAHDGQTVRLMGVEHAPQHGPPRFHVKDLGKSLRVVARHDEFAVEDLMEYAFPRQQTFSQLGIRHRDESIQLRFILGLVAFVHAARDHDAAGTNVQTEWKAALLFNVTHCEIS